MNGPGLLFQSNRSVLVCVAFLYGCATTAQFERTMGTWVGKRYEDFAFTWGQPVQSKVLDSGEVEHFNSVRMGNPGKCETYWVVDQAGIIKRWRYEGEGCKHFRLPEPPFSSSRKEAP